MRNTEYDISVVIPIYNVEDYIRPCLDSLLRQGDVSVQVIMMDDGSTDSSGRIADEYASRYDNFSCYHIPNGGQGNARNKGVGYASGKYLMFADSDDVVPDNTYEKLFRIGERDGSDITICNVARFNSSRIYRSRLHEKAFIGLGCRAALETDHSLLYDTCSYNKLIRRSFYTQNRFAFPTGYIYEDIPFTAHMYLAAKSVSVLHETGYLWREREGDTKSATQKTADIRNLLDRLKAIEETDRIFSRYPVSDDLLLSWRKKLLSTDFMVFCNLCTDLSDELLLSMIDLINDYTGRNMKESDYAHLDPVLQKKYEAIRSRDIGLLRKVREYERSKAYEEAEVREKDGCLTARLDEEIFGAAEYDISEIIRPLHAEISDFSFSAKGLFIEADLYRTRPLIRTEIISAEIFLYNEFSEKSIPLDTEITGNGRIKASFKGDIAAVMPVSDDPFLLVYKCRGHIFDDTGLLRFRGAAKEGIIFPTVVRDDRYVCIEESPLRHPAFFCRDNSFYLRDISVSGKNLRVDLNTPNAPFMLDSADGGRVPCFTVGILHRFEACAIDKMDEGVEYQLIALRNSGRGSDMSPSPVISQKKEVSVLDTKTGFIVADTLRTGIPRLTRHSVIAIASSVTHTDTSMQIAAGIRGASSIKPVSAELIAVSRDGESSYVLGSSSAALNNGEYTFDVSADTLARFTEAGTSSHVIMIQLRQADGSALSLPLYSTFKYSHTVDTAAGPVKVFRSVQGCLSLAAQ